MNITYFIIYYSLHTVFFETIPYITCDKEENALFNDALNTFYLLLYGVGHMVNGHSERKPRSVTWALPVQLRHTEFGLVESLSNKGE